MARTVPAWAGRSVPEYLRFISGLPILSVDSGDPTAAIRWRAVGQACNLTHATGRHGAQFGMAWKGAGITGVLPANSHQIWITLPVADTSLCRARVRIWADSGAGVQGKVFLQSASAGPVSATSATTGAAARYSSAALDVTADVVTADPDAGPYVSLRLNAQDDFASLESVHVDSLERGFGTYPGAATTLPAGLTAGIVPIDDDETAIDSPLSADLLFDIRANANKLAERRQVRAAWADWANTVPNPDTYRTNGGLAPQRIPVMLPVPQGGAMKLTLAAQVSTAPPTPRRVWLVALNAEGSIEGPPLAEWSVSALGLNLSTVALPLNRIRGRFDRRCPSVGLLGYLSCALVVEGAVPERDRLALQGVRTAESDDEIISGGWVLNSLTLWGP